MIRPTSPDKVDTVCLQTIFLHVTKACNLHCSYCYFSARKPMPDEMTAEDFSSFWPGVAAIRPQKVVFTGGEPLLRPDILRLLGGLRDADPDHNILRCLNSNGHLVDSNLARQLVGLVDEVRVSLDGLKDRNDSVRGVGNFDAALAALDVFYSVGFEPKVLVTVTQGTLPDLEDLICLLAARHIRRINVNRFRPIGRGSGHANWHPDWKSIQQAVLRAKQRCTPIAQSSDESHEPDCQTTCGVGQFLNILPNGDVFPCHVLTQPEFRCGNVRDQSIVDICRQSGLLGRLADLDFRLLAQRDQSLSTLSKAGTCMGTVYSQTGQSPAWAKSLPLVQITR